jgi:hypothetical protein
VLFSLFLDVIRYEGEGLLTRNRLPPDNCFGMLQSLLRTWAPAAHWPWAGDFALRAIRRRVRVEMLIARTRGRRGRSLDLIR